MTYLLDVNLLLALAWPTHLHHAIAQEWFGAHEIAGWATCPLTQLGFVRVSSNPRFVDGAVTPKEAIELLSVATATPNHTFWPDDLDLTSDEGGPPPFLVGHRQVTDAYLVRLAQRRGGRLATLDRGISTLLPDAERSTVAVVGT